jgi:hypothetical protein
VQGGPSADWLLGVWKVLLQFSLPEGAAVDILTRLPLIPVTDGRLVRIHYRHTVLAVPQPSEIPGDAASAPIAEEGGSTVAPTLEEPWTWVLPILQYLHVPVLDARFGDCSSIVGPKPVEGEPVGSMLLRWLRSSLMCPEPDIIIKVLLM